MNIAIVGCGFVADYYLNTLRLHSHLKLLGVMDKVQERAERISNYYSVPIYKSLEELLADPSVDIVLNLTNPRNHYEVSRQCLEAGKHVYSEKPLAVAVSDAKELVELANRKGLQISSAPCSVLGETAQTIWKALRENKVGPVRLVYAEMDDGLIHKMSYQEWQSESGTPWPYKDEFEVGCTLEHAGYYLNWLTAFFGPAERVVAFSSCLIADKKTDCKLDPPDTPDFSLACIKFRSGVVARLTCSIIAPHEHSLRIIGEEGILSIEDCWHYDSPVYVQNFTRSLLRRRIKLSTKKKKYPHVRKTPKFKSQGAARMDFCRGVAEMAAALQEGRSNRMAADISLHNNELAIAIQNALDKGESYELTTTFEPVIPMTWAR